MRELNIIGDINGNYYTLMALLRQMPDCHPLLVGDLCDRGINTPKVFKWAMENAWCLLGNHDHMFVDAYYDRKFYMKHQWPTYNGGIKTIKSFGTPDTHRHSEIIDHYREPHIYVMPPDVDDWCREWKNYIPEKYAKWVDSFKFSYEQEGLFVSHAARNPNYTLERLRSSIGLGVNRMLPLIDREYTENSLIWNRGSPRRMKDVFQIFGHNHYFEEYKDRESAFAMCIDTDKSFKLTGVHWPSLEMYEQIIEEKK